MKTEYSIETARTYGYVRISSKDQNEARQVQAMKDYGISERDIIVEKQSGKDFNREQYQLLVNHLLRPGDILVVKSIDRLGRNYNEILSEWKHINKEIGADIVVLDMPLLDTRQSKDLMGTLISDIVLQLLSYVAENERENIRQRQAEGIRAAKSRGAHLGRPKKLPENFESIYAQWQAGLYTAAQCCSILGMSTSTFFRRVKEYENQRES